MTTAKEAGGSKKKKIFFMFGIENNWHPPFLF
jgi:hypothetical protein